jgi:hypothetical protein
MHTAKAVSRADAVPHGGTAGGTRRQLAVHRAAGDSVSGGTQHSGGGLYSSGIQAAAGGSCTRTQQPATRTQGEHSATLTDEVAGALTTRKGETGASRRHSPAAIQPDRALTSSGGGGRTPASPARSNQGDGGGQDTGDAGKGLAEGIEPSGT